MVFQAGPTSARDEAGKNFWRKLLKLLETIISVSEDDYIDDYDDFGDIHDESDCDNMSLAWSFTFVLYGCPQTKQKNALPLQINSYTCFIYH